MMSETGSQSQPDEALVDLLIKQVTEGLSPAEQRALDVLDSATAREYLRDFERAAAAISLAGILPSEPPAPLRSRIEQQAESYFAAERAAGRSSGAAAARAAELGGAVTAGVGSAAANVVDFKAGAVRAAAAPVAAPDARRASRGGALGWFAAAACLVLALFGWFRPVQLGGPPVADVPVALPPAVVTPPKISEPVPPTPAEQRDALLANTDTIKVTLGATKDPAAKGVTGDVVWNPVTQRGYLHFVGLASNDPTIRQYQIWIFDGNRDKRYPVDGGVFDVPADATEVVIPIHAALPISAAAAFAVTVEKAGGVVVSNLGHVVVLGKAS